MKILLRSGMGLATVVGLLLCNSAKATLFWEADTSQGTSVFEGLEESPGTISVAGDPLGIYGNCIVVDHGYGLQSIYGHLSEIAVHEGDMVKRGQVMGKSGQTGMAGGDHIHFSMQLEGIQIDPKEWWDAHWIKDHIAKRVALPADGK